MAALIPHSQQLSTGNPLYETYYKQVDPTYTGRVGASEAALFLKKSGLPDIILGKIWDLADPEGKGYLDKQHDTSSPLLITPPSTEAYWAVRAISYQLGGRKSKV